MSATSDGMTYFHAYFGDANLKFGVPTAVAQGVVESTKKSIQKKTSLATAIENGERAIAEAFRNGRHRNQKSSKKMMAPFIISCCLLSKEALENPDARGFILEISNSTLPSWVSEQGESASDDAFGDQAEDIRPL